MTLVLTFLALAHAAQYATFNVQSISGQPYHVAMMNPENGISVQDLKESIKREHNIPVEYQELLFGIEVLHNDDIIQPETHPTLTLYKIAPPLDSLHDVCARGYVDGIQCLIAAGCNLNQVDRYGYTGLTHALMNGHLDVVRLLIESGVDPNQTFEDLSYDGMTPLGLASYDGHSDVVRLLLEFGVDPNQTDQTYNRTSALNLAAERGHSNVVRILVEEGGCNPNHADFWGKTALIKAANYPDYGDWPEKSLEVARILLQAGADYKHVNKDGHTAMSLASKNGHTGTMLQILRRKRPFAWF